jgi:hypothetical protein
MLISATAMVGCKGLKGGTPDYGGIAYRCKVIWDQLETPAKANFPIDYSIPLTTNRCAPRPNVLWTAEATASDQVYNCLDFPVDTTVHPNCKTFLVDSCQPQITTSILNPKKEFNLNNVVDLSYVESGVQLRVMDNCVIATAFAITLDQNRGAKADDPFIGQLAVSWYSLHRQFFMVALKGDIVYLQNGEATPNYTRPVATAPLCYADKFSKDNDGGFPVYLRSLSPNLTNSMPASIANIDPARSAVTITVGDKQASTSVRGNILGEISSCGAVGGGVQRCEFRITHSLLALDDFTIDGKTVSGASLASRGVGLGRFVQGDPHSFAIIDSTEPGIVFDSQFRLDGTQGNYVLDQNPNLLGVWEPQQNNFAMGLSLSTKEDDGTVIQLHGNIAGTFQNQSPVPVPGADQQVECQGPNGTVATLDGSKSYDYDGNLSEYDWIGPVADGTDPVVAFSHAVVAQTPPLPLGLHKFMLRLFDAWRWTDREFTTVNVVDTLPPTVTGAASPDCLWPPNHKTALYRLGTELVVKANDQCSGDLTSSVRIKTVTSNENNADGSPTFVFDDKSVCLTAERDGGGAGRDYTITVEAKDQVGNVSTKDVIVRVPHDQSPADRCRQTQTTDECALLAGAKPDDSSEQATVARATSSAEANNVGTGRGGCSTTGRATSGSECSIVFALLLLVTLARRSTRSFAVAGLLLLSLNACSKSSSASQGNATLTLTVAGGQPVNVTGAPFASLLPNTASFLVMSATGTVYVSFPRRLAQAPSNLTIGITGDTATVWGQTPQVTSPLTTTVGTLSADRLDLSSNGQFSVRVVDAEKTEDAAGPSLRVDGIISGVWNEVQ